MPIFRYRCSMCLLEVDEFRKIANRDEAPICPHDGEPMERRIMPAMVQADIQPYMSTAVDKETGRTVGIQSRKQHREFLRRNDYVEVGNERMKPPKRDEGPDAPMLSSEEIKRMGLVEEAY